MNETPVLYILIRNDLPSMNPGKAVAHGAHAANQFVYECIRPDSKVGIEYVYGVESVYKEWISQVPEKGFGITITLSANRRELYDSVGLARARGLAAGTVVDPSYPYETTTEIANLIEHPEDYPPFIDGDRAICFRKETTAAYLFGYKSDLTPILGHLRLMD